MRVLVADKFEKSGIDGLNAIGCTVISLPDVKDATLVDAIAEHQPEVLIVRSTKVSEAMLDAGPLKLIVRAGAGYNTIDVNAASRRGIYVSNCPGQNSIAVAELTMGLILSIDRRIPDNVAQLRDGKWNKGEFSKSDGLFGKTLGLVGFGKIAQETAIRARAFGMKVIAASRSLTPELAAEFGVEYAENAFVLAGTSDIVSIHLALNSDTKSSISTRFFDAMKDGSVFINTSRGEVVDQEALVAAMNAKGIKAGLDVFADEPAGASGEYAHEIINHPNMYGTHHIGASTNQAQEAIAAESIRIVKIFIETGSVPNVVNIAKSSPATHKLVVRHIDRPGVLAYVLDILKSANINVQEMENIIFEGAQAAVARINIDSPLPDDVFFDIKSGNKDILEVTMIANDHTS